MLLLLNLIKLGLIETDDCKQWNSSLKFLFWSLSLEQIENCAVLGWPAEYKFDLGGFQNVFYESHWMSSPKV